MPLSPDVSENEISCVNQPGRTIRDDPVAQIVLNDGIPAGVKDQQVGKVGDGFMLGKIKQVGAIGKIQHAVLAKAILKGKDIRPAIAAQLIIACQPARSSFDAWA